MADRQVFWCVLLERNPIGECMDYCLSVAERAALMGYQRMRPKYGRTDATRNQIAQTFLANTTNDDDTLVMLDNDHIHPFDVIEKLIAADKPVVAALAFKRGTPPEPCAYIHDPRDPEGHYHSLGHIPENAIGQVDCVGHAALAVKRSALLQLINAGYLNNWWRYEYWVDGGSPSEDMYFAKICQAAGVPQYVHTGVESPHHKSGYVTRKDWSDYIDAHPGIVGHRVPLSVSVVMPTRGRPEQLKACIRRLFASVEGSHVDVECLVVVDHDDEATYTALASIEGDDSRLTFITNDDPEATAVMKWNAGARMAKGDWFVLGADDLWFHDGWLTAALEADENASGGGGGFVGFNDCHTDGTAYATHYMMRRDYLTKFNGGVLACPHYHSWYIDVEAAERAKRAHTYTYAADAVVEHRHPVWSREPGDETYRRGQKWHTQDQETFFSRARAGFPDDYDPVITERITPEAVAA